MICIDDSCGCKIKMVHTALGCGGMDVLNMQLDWTPD